MLPLCPFCYESSVKSNRTLILVTLSWFANQNAIKPQGSFLLCVAHDSAKSSVHMTSIDISNNNQRRGKPSTPVHHFRSDISIKNWSIKREIRGMISSNVFWIHNPKQIDQHLNSVHQKSCNDINEKRSCSGVQCILKLCKMDRQSFFKVRCQ